MNKLVYGFDRLHSNCDLSENIALMSRNQAYFAILRSDGNFCIYVSNHFIKRNIIWNTNIKLNGLNPYRLRLDENGIIKIIDKDNKIIWNNSEIIKGKAPYQLIMQDDGNLVIYDGSGKAIWAKGNIER